jgi:hypothetical protein
MDPDKRRSFRNVPTPGAKRRAALESNHQPQIRLPTLADAGTHRATSLRLASLKFVDSDEVAAEAGRPPQVATPGA